MKPYFETEDGKLYCNDCLEAIPELDFENIKLVVTDPPFNYRHMGSGFSKNSKLSNRTYLYKIKQLKNGCDFEPEPMLDILWTSMDQFYGYFFCNKTLVNRYINWAINKNLNYDILIMGKINCVPAHHNHHLSDIEYVMLIRAPGTYFSDDEQFHNYKKIQLVSCKTTKIHPCQKSVASMYKYIRVSSKAGDIILDPYFGSGTTGIACRRLDRKWIGIEDSKEICDIAIERIKQETAQYKMELT